MHWYDQTLRKVHILYVSPEWSKRQGDRFSAKEYVEGLKTAGVDCVQVYGKDHHGYCYYKARQGRPYPRDVFAELVPAVHEADMRFVGYFSVGLDAWALGMYPEWAAMDRDGQPFVRRHFFRACLNSGYRKFALEQFEDLASGYELDGAWLDIIPLAYPAPEVGYAVQRPVPCHCPACCRLYRDRFGRDLPLEPTAEEKRQIYFFMIDGVRSLLEEFKAVLLKHRPEAMLSYNFAGAWADPVDTATVVSIEGHAPEYRRQSLVSRWGRTSGKPFEILTPGALPNGFGGWDGWDGKPAEVLRIECGIAAAHGGNAVFGVAPYTDGSVDKGQWQLIGRAFDDLAKVEEHCINPKSGAEIGLVLAAKPRTVPEPWVEQVAEVEVYHEALLDMQAQFDVLHSAEGLDRYRLVIVPDQPSLTAAEGSALREYVRKGGRLIAAGRTSLWDEEGKPRADFALADVLGVRYRETLQYPFNFLRVDDAEGSGRDIPDIPILSLHQGIRVELNGAEQLGRLFPPETARNWSTTVLWGTPAPDMDRVAPGITRNRFGDGVAIYVALPLAAKNLESVWAKLLIQNLTRSLLPDPIVDARVPGGVEVVLNRQEGRWVLHLVDTRWGDPIHPAAAHPSTVLHNVEISLDVGRLGDISKARIAGGGALDLRTNGCRFELTVPELGIHTVLVLE